MIDWLFSLDAKQVALLQLAATAILAAAGVLVALAGFAVSVVAAIINYGNSTGWKPVLLSEGGFMAEGDRGVYTAVSFEIWNRRKYPIAVKAVRVTFGNLRLIDRVKIFRNELDDDWSISPAAAQIYSTDGIVIEGGGHRPFRVAARVQEFGEIPDISADVRVAIYDPKKNKHYGLRRQSKKGTTISLDD